MKVFTNAAWHCLGVFYWIALFISCSAQNAIIKQTGDRFDPLSFAVDFYRNELNHLSAVRGSECPMYPACSEYSLESVKKHGLLIGWIMTCDRLMRCGRDELHLSPVIRTDANTWKCYDPVKNNDFWWYKKNTTSNEPKDMHTWGPWGHEWQKEYNTDGQEQSDREIDFDG